MKYSTFAAPLSDEAFDTLHWHHRWIRNFYDKKFW